jgi:nicotinamidase-related amidase
MNARQFVKDSRPFLEWLVAWYNSRPRVGLERLIGEAGGAEHVAVMAVDMTTGFCSQGALSSPRVGSIVPPIVRLYELAYRLGVRHFVMPQDTHDPNAVEFGSYPPHCVVGSDESQTVVELRSLPFSGQFTILEKNSLSVSINTGLDDWLAAHPEVTTFLVVGDCTDLCTHQLAMHLRLRANAFQQHGVRVIVPIDGVNTFDTPLSVAEELGIMPHPADLLHLIFLYNMAENGVEVVSKVE